MSHRKAYYIVNKETSTDGKSLAVTYNGSNALLTVTEFKKLTTQVWVITGNDVRNISSLIDLDLFVSYTEDPKRLRPIDGAANIWSIVGNDVLCTIRYFDLDLYWNLEEGKVDEIVLGRLGPRDNKQYWRLIPVDARE